MEKPYISTVRENDLCKLETLDAAPVFRRLGFCFVVCWVGFFFLSEKKELTVSALRGLLGTK